MRSTHVLPSPIAAVIVDLRCALSAARRGPDAGVSGAGTFVSG